MKPPRRAKPKDDSPFDPAQMAEQLAKAMEMCEPLLETVIGYRERCTAAGFNETAAEQMALTMHAKLLGFG